MKSKKNVTLQINLAPSDYKISKHLIRHQIQNWSKQVEEILLTVDLHRSRGRFGDEWEFGKEKLLKIIKKISDVRIVFVDYNKKSQQKVANEWTGGKNIPFKDFRGGPCFAYFFGLSESRGRFVLHSDADMFFGGGSQKWINEAVDLLESDSDVLFVAPFPGPPKRNQINDLGKSEKMIVNKLKKDFMSTRLFMIDKEKFRKSIGKFNPSRPSMRSMLKGLIEGNPSWDLPEHWMTAAMTNVGMCQTDLLGSSPGMWSLHPPYRNKEFFEKLPALIDCIETGKIPEGQLGFYDINDSMVDWSDARQLLKTNRWWNRLFRKR